MFYRNENKSWQPHIGRLELFVVSFIQRGTKGVEWNTDQNTFAFWDFTAVFMQRIVCTGVFEDRFVCWFQKVETLSCWADNNVHVCRKNTIKTKIRFYKLRSGTPQQDAHPTVVSGHFSTGGNTVRSADKGEKVLSAEKEVYNLLKLST